MSPKKEQQTPKKKEKKDQGEDSLHAELVAKRVAAIGRRVFSPQVQMQVLALAEEIRASWRTTGGRVQLAAGLRIRWSCWPW